MPLDALLAALDADAERERRAVLAEAAETAEAVRSRAEREVRERRAAVLAETRLDEERAARTEIVRTRTEARRLVFDARHRVLARVRAAAGERIDAAGSDPLYGASLEDEVRAALRRVPKSSEGVVRVAPDLAAEVRAAVSATLRGSGAEGGDTTRLAVVEDPGTPPGFVVDAEEGRLVVDATLPARLEMEWAREAMRVLTELRS